METDKINQLIVYILAIANYAKDIHYNCYGTNFYGNHLLADRIYNGLFEFLDELKEVCLLGHMVDPLDSREYQKQSIEVIPKVISFDAMRQLLIDTLQHIENIENVSQGDNNLLGSIAQKLQNDLGLLNIMLKDAN